MASRTTSPRPTSPATPLRPLPATDFPSAALELARDAFYVAVGLGVIGVRNAQERRHQAITALDDRLAPLRERLESLRPTFDLPTIDLPTIDLPTIELPTIDLPRIDLGAGLDRDRLQGNLDALNERFEELRTRVLGAA